MTTLKGPLSEDGDGSPDFGVQPGPPVDTAAAAVEVAATLPPALPPARAEVPAPVMPQVIPAHADDCNALDYIQIVRAEVVRGGMIEPGAPAEAEAPPPDLPVPALPVVMPAVSDTAGALDFVRFVKAEVIHEKPPAPVQAEPIAEVADIPAPPAQLEPVALRVPPIDAAAVAPAAAATFDPMPAPPLPFPAPAPAPVTKSIQPAWRRWAKRAAIVLVGLMIGYATLVIALILAYRTIDPPLSTLMLELRLRGEEVDYRPVPLTSVSSYLQRAVIMSEDARFCSHRGVDWGALAEAIQDSRGGSTITMQTAKNLFLWPSRSYIRKAIEIPVALTIDFAWPKRRVLEVYLNIAEWGPGIFGAEAAAQYHFNKSAARLTPHEATLLAAVLPNPIARDAGDPGRVTELLASRLRGRMAHSDAYVGCLGLRPMPRAEPAKRPKVAPPPTSKAAPNAAPWQTKTTKTEPAKPTAPAFNPWQN